MPDKSVYEQSRQHGEWPLYPPHETRELYEQATAPIPPSDCTCHALCTCDDD